MVFKSFFLILSADSGIGLENGVFITAIVQGSPAAREGSLTVGDRLIAVSLSSVLGMFLSSFHPHLPLCSSLRVLIHDLFHSTPHFKARIG